MTPVKMFCTVTPPHDGSGWNATVDIVNVPGRGRGSAEGTSVSDAFSNALLVALATSNEPEPETLS
jgi:hypothetical protein